MPKQVETAVLVLSDLHVGKKTPKYNFNVAAESLRLLATTVGRILTLLESTYEFDEGVILFLGDCVDGTEIYPEQAHQLEIHSVVQQCLSAAQITMPIVDVFMSHCPKVRLAGVAGNHGRAGKYAIVSSNWDLVYYQELTTLAKGKYGNKITADFPVINVKSIHQMEESFWLKPVKVRKHWFLIHHGHGPIRSFADIPFYGIIRRGLKWRTSLPYPWKLLIHGHYHQYAHLRFNDVEILLNGTLVQHDLWGLETFAAQEQNVFHFFGVSDKMPITWHYAIRCDAATRKAVKAAT